MRVSSARWWMVGVGEPRGDSNQYIEDMILR